MLKERTPSPLCATHLLRTVPSITETRPLIDTVALIGSSFVHSSKSRTLDCDEHHKSAVLALTKEKTSHQHGDVPASGAPLPTVRE